MSKDKLSKEIVRLIEFAVKLELSEQVCVFIDVSGHVDWVDIAIRKSKKEYDVRYGNWTISYKGYDDKFVKPSDLKKRVDTVIKEITKVVSDLKKANKEAEERHKQAEIKKLEELKAKYEL